MKKVNFALSFLFYSLVTVLCILIIASVAAKKSGSGPFYIFGYNTTLVMSGSMLPEIPVYSLNVVQDCKFDDLQIGDILIYKSTTGINICHRAIDSGDLGGKKYFVVKGDANDQPDAEIVTVDNYVGKITKTLGWTADIFSNVIEPDGTTINKTRMLEYMALLAIIVSTAVGAICSCIKFIFAKLYKLCLSKRNTNTKEDNLNGVQSEEERSDGSPDGCDKE